MLIGIVKNNKEIKGDCSIIETFYSYNKTITIKCNDVLASSKDSIICLCDECNKEFVINKRNFFKASMEVVQYCISCKWRHAPQELLKKRSFIQKKRWKDGKCDSLIKYKTKKEKIENKKRLAREKNKTKSKEELSELRSKNAEKLWMEGRYRNLIKYKNEEERKKYYKEKQKEKNKTKSKEELSELRSKNAKKLWVEGRYDNLNYVRRVSNFQIEVFNSINDGNWIIEYPINISDEIRYFVDCYNPITNEIIECFGDYWHCNPNLYKKDFYHKRVHKTAKEIWEQDKIRIENLEKLDYSVKIIWESDWKNRKK